MTTINSEQILIETDSAPQVHQLIGGVWGPSDNGQWLPVENPARRTTIAYIPESGESDVNRAVDAAAEAFKSWGVLPPREPPNTPTCQPGLGFLPVPQSSAHGSSGRADVIGCRF